VRDAYYALLADPSPESWRGVCKLLSDHRATDAQLLLEARELRRELAAWPPEVERPPADGWAARGGRSDALADALFALCRSVREVDLYDHYVAAAREAPALRLRDGTPAVRLQRQFTGALQGARGRTHRIGKRGNADLNGSLCVEWWTCGAGCRVPRPLACGHSPVTHNALSVAVEVEVKRAAGVQDPAQVTRMEALRRRGEVYVLARRTDEMVRLLVAERDRYLTLLTEP